MNIFVDFITGRVFQFDIDTTPADKYTYTIGQNAAAVTLGNTTAKTLLHTITIPKGTLKIGDSVKVLFSFTCNNNANAKTISASINGSGTSFGVISGTAHTGGIMECTIKVASLTQVNAINTSNNSSYGLTNLASPRVYAVSDITNNDFTIDIYGQKITAGTDTLILEHAIGIIQKS
jgi:hypothetical protein